LEPYLNMCKGPAGHAARMRGKDCFFVFTHELGHYRFATKVNTEFVA